MVPGASLEAPQPNQVDSARTASVALGRGRASASVIGAQNSFKKAHTGPDGQSGEGSSMTWQESTMATMVACSLPQFCPGCQRSIGFSMEPPKCTLHSATKRASLSGGRLPGGSWCTRIASEG